jgi:hypothetical protein
MYWYEVIYQIIVFNFITAMFHQNLRKQEYSIACRKKLVNVYSNIILVHPEERGHMTITVTSDW